MWVGVGVGVLHGQPCNVGVGVGVGEHGSQIGGGSLFLADLREIVVENCGCVVCSW